jgi:hypothetical protein
LALFRPALFVKDYIDKIFAAAGYTYDCDLFDTDRFKSLLVPHNQKTLTALRKSALNAAVTNSYTVLDDTTPSALQIWDTFSSTIFSINGANNLFTYTGTDANIFNITYGVTGKYFLNGYDSFGFQILKNASIVLFQKDYTTGGGGEIAISELVNVTTNLATNDTISVFFFAIGTSTAGDYLIIDESTLYAESTVAITQPLAIGDTVQVNDTIPRNILQKDFFASIIKLFNLYVIEDTTKANGLKIQPFVDFYIDDELDWTGKLDRSKPIRLTPMSNVNARFFDFKFKDDSDYYNETYKKKWGQMYGDYSFDSEFDFENERATCEVIFSPTPLVGYSGEDKVYSTILKLENNIEQTTNSNIRILQFANVTGVTSWNINGVSSGLTNYGYAGHYDNPDAPSNDIHFGVPNELYFTLSTGNLSNQQFNLYWSEYMAEITDKDSKLLTATFKLDVLDIINLDFGKLIWIDGALWRLNKIEDYNMSNPDLCTVSLLKVIEKVY